MYAIIESGGKQYRVAPGDVISLEKLEGKVGETLTFDKVLLVGGKSGTAALVGAPYVSQASTQVEIVEQGKGEKILTIKYRRRKGYRRTIGHRQLLSRVLVTKIENGQGETAAFDSSKRAEVLTKASVKFSTRQESRKPTAPKAKAEASAPVKKEASAKAAAPKKTASKTAGEKAPAKKKTAKKAE